MSNLNRSQQSSRTRAALSNVTSRHVALKTISVDGSFDHSENDRRRFVVKENAKKIITYNNSPDVPFDRSINPYRGCEHGCIYCFARPSHAWMDLSPGLDFEQRLFTKPNAPTLLRNELQAKNYCAKPIALGVNTDAYQPLEKTEQITRQTLEVLLEYRHPVVLITKSALVERDINLLQQLAKHRLVKVMVSVTSLDKNLSHHMEPRAATPMRRLRIIRSLSDAGVPTGIMIAPVIPVLTEHQLEDIMFEGREAGAMTAAYVMLRLPREVSELFEEWLHHYYPGQAKHVMNRVRDMRRGKNHHSEFGERMNGSGIIAKLISQRFRQAYDKLGFSDLPELDTSAFRHPNTAQLSLF